MEIAFSDKISISFKKDILLTPMIYVVWAYMAITYLRGVFLRLPVIKDNVEIAIILYFAIPVILAIPSLFNKFCLGDHLFYLANVLFLLSGYVFFPENTEYLNENILTCIFCIFPFYFLGRIIEIEKSFDAFLLLSAACILLDLFYFLVYAQNNKNMEEVAGQDNMFAAYQILPHVAFLLWATLKKFRIWKIVTTFLGILFLLSCGTRGPLVCLGFFTIIYFFFYMNFKGAVYVKFFILAMASIVIVNLQSIAIALAKVFTGLQLSTRILEKFITGELGNDSYRSVLRDRLYEVLDSGNHFFGLGAFGCRNYDIVYPHVLHLDFFCTYGYLVGTALLILLFLLIGWAFWLSRNTSEQVFLLFLFSITIIKLLLSGTFIQEPYFFLLIGACVKVFLDKRSILYDNR